MTFAAISHWALSLTTVLHTFSSPRPQTVILMLIESHSLSLHYSRKPVELKPVNYSLAETERGAHSSLTSPSSISPLPILLTGWVTSWQSCWPCERKFTARCNHLLCSKCTMLELLHLLERTALYCKCAISIHEGIYMHFQATLSVFISHVAHGRTYGIPSYNGSP